MNYIKINKMQLSNLEHILHKEILRTSKDGNYSTNTIIGCNTRKQHGLLIVPQPQIDGCNHVLLSSIDETLIEHGKEFNLGIRKYKGEYYEPKGHKYITDYVIDPMPKLTYSLGGLELTKELLLTKKGGDLIIKYTLTKSSPNSEILLRFKPFLAYRNINSLSKANYEVDSSYIPIENGVKLRMYQGYSYLYLQFSKQCEYVHFPDWYYNVQYDREQSRGFDCCEDLFVPGYFEMPIEKGESVYFSVSLSELNPNSISRLFSLDLKNRIPRNNYSNCLLNAAEQFIAKIDNKDEIVASYPWFIQSNRDTLISLPGLTLLTGKEVAFKKILTELLKTFKAPLFPIKKHCNTTEYSSIDTPLWFFWTLQQYSLIKKTTDNLWSDYGKYMKAILSGYKNGTEHGIEMDSEGLIFSNETGIALTWMDIKINNKPINPRIGYAVEVNALWYNAIMFALQLAKENKDSKFIAEWEVIANMIPQSFINKFWSDAKGYLADYVHDEFKDFSVRPNQVFATSLEYSPIDNEKKVKILNVVKSELLTSRGLRSLAPKNPRYKGLCEGLQETRNIAYHNGTVFPWLLGAFAEGYLKIYNKTGVEFITKLYNGFESEMLEHGLGTISEVYNGDPPHSAIGGISQAWNIAELIRTSWLIGVYAKKSSV